jgi:3-oxoacyl-[acyl-carrier protein] reductase
MTDKKIWFITGAGRGMGVDIAKAALAAGNAVVATGRNPDNVAKAVGAADDLLVAKLDVTRPADAEAAVQAAVDRFGGIDVLVNNASIFATIPMSRVGFEDISGDEWDRLMAVNLKGPWLCCRAVVPYMRQRGKGKIINIASGTIFAGGGGTRAHYVASKAGVVGLTRTLAQELGKDNICVNTLAPGSTLSETDPSEQVLEMRQRNVGTRALKRVERPEDLVGTVLFLASDDADFITGQMIVVDGGDNLH